MKKIEFETIAGLDGIINKPEPAKKFVPDWYKKMSKEVFETYTDPNQGIMTGRTIKACPPILDYMTTGYMLTTYTDLSIVESGLSKEEGPPYQIHTPRVDWKSIDIHSPDQFTGSTFSGKAAYKLTSPWNIKTPMGYSCLFMRPFFSDTKGINVIPAIVDTDVYHNINFPFTLDEPLDMSENKEHFIPKGTPFMLVVPFKREPWKASYSSIREEIFFKHTRAVNTVVKNFYKNLTRSNKRTFL